MPHKNRPELFWQHLSQLILFLQTSQVVGAYWRVNIFCSCLQPWSESYVKVGLKYTKFYFDIHITYFLNYQIPSNFACIIFIIRVNIWQKNILKNLIFSKNLASFWQKSGEFWRNFYLSIHKNMVKAYMSNISLGSNFGVFGPMRLECVWWPS